MNKRTCTIDGCTKPHRARGLCATHYNQTHQPNRHMKKLVPCAYCGTEVLKGTGGGRVHGAVCSDQCRQWLSTPYCVLPQDHWARWYGKTSRWKPKRASVTVAERGRMQRSDLRVALEDGDGPLLLDVLFQESDLTDEGCWTWSRSSRNGYPVYQMKMKSGKSKTFRLHRASLEARLGNSLGKQAAHHVCANSMCVNPDHLQPISFRENTAEMMQRNFYVQRINDLEAALASVAPHHPELAVVSLPKACG